MLRVSNVYTFPEVLFKIHTKIDFCKILLLIDYLIGPKVLKNYSSFSSLNAFDATRSYRLVALSNAGLWGGLGLLLSSNKASWIAQMLNHLSI